MARKHNRTEPRPHPRRNAPSRRSGVSRREYAELVVRLGTVELQSRRYRAELETHARRIAQLQEQLERLKPAATPAAHAADIVVMPLPSKPVVES